MSRVTRAWRIYTDQPSSGKPIQLVRPPGLNNGFLTTGWSDIAEAKDFSLPDTGGDGVTPDPDNNDRELRPGEVFFETPLAVVNYVDVPRWFELRLIQQGGNETPGLQEILIAQRISVPPKEALFFPIQGFRLFKTSFTSTRGDRLQGRAEADASLKFWGSAVELELANHAPDTEA
jgi:hypothetical protein